MGRSYSDIFEACNLCSERHRDIGIKIDAKVNELRMKEKEEKARQKKEEEEKAEKRKSEEKRDKLKKIIP